MTSNKERYFQPHKDSIKWFLPVLFGLGVVALTGCIVDPGLSDDFKKDVGKALELMEAEQAARAAEMEAREAARRAEMEAQEAARRAEMDKIKARLAEMSNTDIAAAENDCSSGYSRKTTALCDVLVERRDLVTIAMVEFQRDKEKDERKTRLAMIQTVRDQIVVMSDDELVAAVDDCREKRQRTFFCEVIAQSEDLVEAVKTRRIAALLQEKTDDEVLQLRHKHCQRRLELLRCQIPDGAYAQVSQRLYDVYISNLDKLKEDYNYCLDEGDRLGALQGRNAKDKLRNETARCVVAASTIRFLNSRSKTTGWERVSIWSKRMP